MSTLNDSNEKKVYEAEDIGRMLHMSRSKTYLFLNETLESEEPPFRVLRIGKLLRVPKREFDAWLLGEV